MALAGIEGSESAAASSTLRPRSNKQKTPREAEAIAENFMSNRKPQPLLSGRGLVCCQCAPNGTINSIEATAQKVNNQGLAFNKMVHPIKVMASCPCLPGIGTADDSVKDS